MKALQVKGVANVGVITCLQKRVKNLTDGQEQYKTALRTLKVSMDDPFPTTPAGDAIPEETDDSTELEQDTQDDSVVLAQPAMNPPVVPLTSSANPLVVDGPLTQDAPNQTKGDRAQQDLPAS